MTKLKRLLASSLIIPSLGMTTISVASDIRVQNGDSVTFIGQDLKIYSINSENIVTEIQNQAPPKEESPVLVIPQPEKPNIVEAIVDNTPVEVPVPNPEPVSKYGEYIHWSEAQKLIPRGKDFKAIDYLSGESFMLRRSVGTNHADVETLTAADTRLVKRLWGGNFSWERRPIIVEVDGRRLAASLAAMPHAGRDDQPGGKVVDGRSGGYSRGVNLDYVKGNEMDGVMDLHFLGSVGHSNPTPNKAHQDAIKVAAGIPK